MATPMPAIRWPAPPGSPCWKRSSATTCSTMPTTIGALLKAELERPAERYPFIGDVRGKGLLLASEFVADRETMAPLPKQLERPSAGCRHRL